MDFFIKFFEYFSNNDVRISSKLKMILFIMLCIFIIDNVLGFSFYYNINKKINQIISINEVLKDSNMSIGEVNQLFKLRKSVIERENLFDKISLFINGFFNQDKQDIENASNMITDSIIISKNNLMPQDTIKITGIPNTIPANNNIIISAPIRNNLSFLLSCSWLFMFIILISPVLLLDKKRKLIYRFINIFQIIFIMIVLSILFYELFGLIPRLGNDWTWNYILNSAIQLVIVYIINYILGKTNN